MLVCGLSAVRWAVRSMVAGVQGSVPLALVGLVVLSCCLSPQRAGASTGYSLTPSSTEPYAVCPAPSFDRVQCLSIIAPRSAVAVPAPSAASTVGASPELGVSPSCFLGEYAYCGSGYNHGFSPQDLESGYKLPSTSAGEGQTVAVVDPYDDPNAQADLNVYRATYDLPPCKSGCFTKVNQEGASKYPEANAQWSLEISLDLDMVSAACPECHILLVEANSNTLKDLGLAENEAVALGATEISNSYAAKELVVGKKQLGEETKYYQHPGVPITVASGDQGYNDEQESNSKQGKCTNCSTNYPAGFSSVIAVGGAELEPSEESTRGWSDWTWFDSGSGCSLYVAKPPWQTDKGCSNRSENDVSAEASSETPVSVYDTYSLIVPGWQDVGGTSASAPFVAGAIALESSTQRSEGLEGIYAHPGNWFDVTQGFNWAFVACPELYLCHGETGYDGPTGMGTLNGGATATPPGAMTVPASAVTKTGAQLNAVVNPEASPTKYYFQYGATVAYGKQTSLGTKVASYTKSTAVSQSISGLYPASGYHYRVVAVSAGGTTHGPDIAFSTAAKVYQSKFGSLGAAGGHFNGPQRSATDVHGDVWVTDYSNNRIEEFSSTGEFIRACGSKGSGNGQFEGPTGIAVNPTSSVIRGGYIYVSDSGNGRIEVFSPECTFAETIGEPGSGNGQLSAPMGLTFGTKDTYTKAPGVLLVADSGNNRIEEFNWYLGNAQWKAGQFVTTYGSKGSGEGQFSNPTDVVLAATEHIRAEEFFVVDSENSRVEEIEEEEASGSHPAASYKYLGQFGSKGSGNGQFSNPSAIVLDPTTGDVNISDTGNNRIEEFLPSGTYVAKFGASGSGNEQFASPKGIAVDSSGRLDIVDSANNRIDVWASSSEAHPEWKVTTSLNPSGALNSSLYGVSCVSSSMCAAVGYYTSEKEASVYKSLGEVWNGTEWQLAPPLNPAGSSRTFLYGVSCASSTRCTGVGYYRNSLGIYLSLAELWNGTEWQVQPTPEPVGSLGSILSGVACTSSTACTAVGWYENGAGVEASFAERWNGTAWSVQSTPTPTGAKASYPYGVSCASSTACTMAGYYVNGAGVQLPFAESWNGTEWSVKTMPNPAEASSTAVSALSCASSSSCIAVGYYLNGAGAYAPLAEGWNGTEWSLQAPPAPTGAKSTYLYGVSCASSVACTASGSFLNGSGKSVPLTESWNGLEWEIQPGSGAEPEEGSLSGGTSCASLISCMAVGGRGAKTLAEVYG